MAITTRRQRPTISALTVMPRALAAPPARRMVTTSNRIEKLAADRQKIMDNLKLISECDAAIDHAQENKDVALNQIEELMRQNKLPTQDNGQLIAELVETFTNQRRTIDPQKFRNKVLVKDFWASIEVSVTRAKLLLGEKELDAISDVIPSKSNGTVLKVRELAKKKRK